MERAAESPDRRGGVLGRMARYTVRFWGSLGRKLLRFLARLLKLTGLAAALTALVFVLDVVLLKDTRRP